MHKPKLPDCKFFVLGDLTDEVMGEIRVIRMRLLLNWTNDTNLVTVLRYLRDEDGNYIRDEKDEMKKVYEDYELVKVEHKEFVNEFYLRGI